MSEVRVYSQKQKIPQDVFKIDLQDYPALDPVNVGPCLLYKGRRSINLHNAWEYSKVYKEHTLNGQPTNEYWEWAQNGWNSKEPAKITKKKCLYHLWDGIKYGVIEARKNIFASKYIRAVSDVPEYIEIKSAANSHNIVGLIAKHGIDHKKYSLTEILFSPDKELDYAFLLAMMLSRDPSLTDIP